VDSKENPIRKGMDTLLEGQGKSVDALKKMMEGPKKKSG
jgi:hypothetical protein